MTAEASGERGAAVPAAMDLAPADAVDQLQTPGGERLLQPSGLHRQGTQGDEHAGRLRLRHIQTAEEPHPTLMPLGERRAQCERAVEEILERAARRKCPSPRLRSPPTYKPP